MMRHRWRRAAVILLAGMTLLLIILQASLRASSGCSVRSIEPDHALVACDGRLLRVQHDRAP